MKMLLTLVVVAAVLNGTYQVGMDEYRYSEFKDSVHSMLSLGKDTPVDDLKQRMLQKAVELKLPVTEDKVTVSREGVRTSVSVSYTSQPELFPAYKYPRDHSFTDEIAAIR